MKTVFSFNPVVLQEKQRKSDNMENIVLNFLFMNNIFWLIMSCKSECKDI